MEKFEAKLIVNTENGSQVNLGFAVQTLHIIVIFMCYVIWGSYKKSQYFCPPNYVFMNQQSYYVNIRKL